jgi:multiple sugar transport system substrate-binding protein
MSNTKRTFIIAAAASLLLAACDAGPAPAPEATASNAMVSDMSGELTIFTIGGPPAEALKATETLFTQRFPNVTVKINVQDVQLSPAALNPQDAGAYAFGLIARQNANELEDIFFNADLFVPQFVEAGLAMDIEPLAKSDTVNVLDDIYPNVLALGKMPAQPGVFMMPMGLETVQMYFNKTLFEKAGAPLPTATMTWDDLLAACRLIDDYKADTYCFDMGNGTWWPYFLPFIEGHGGRALSGDGQSSTLSSPQSRAGLAAFADLWQEQYGAVPAGVNIRGNCFTTGRCATLFQISAFIPAVRQLVGSGFEWDVQRMPAHPNGQYAGLTALGFSINKTAKNPQMAWEFLKLLAHPDVQLELFKSRQTIPMLKSLSTHPEVASPVSNVPPQNMAAFVQAGEMGIVPPAYPLKCGSYYSGVVLETMTSLIASIIDDPTTLERATQTADDEIQACLNE